MKLTQKTKINTIIIIDKNKPNVVVSKNMNMTLLEWTMIYSFSDDALSFGRLPNLLDMNFKLDSKNFIYKQDGSNDRINMTSYIFDDNNYRVFVNIFDK